MSVKKDPNGRRSVEVSVEVPGTPEEVWDAIATGPGISSWFVPTKVEERVGGIVASNFGPGMESQAVITEWSKPHRMAAESHGDLGTNGPPIATEWIVETRSGGKCVVKVVHSWFASNDDWDAQFEQFEQFEQGWPGFFRILKLYLEHFSGQNCVLMQLSATARAPKEAAWSTLLNAIGVSKLVEGQRIVSTEIAAPLAGIVEHVGPIAAPENTLIRVDQPAPGIANLFAMPMGEIVYLSVRFYLFGDKAPGVVAASEGSWQTWLNQKFPQAGTPSASCTNQDN